MFSNQLVSAILNCVWLDVLDFVPPLFVLLYLMSSTVSMLNSARLVFVHCFWTLWPFNQVDRAVSKNLIEIHNDSFVNQDLCRFQYAHCLTFHINWFVHCTYLKREKRTNVRNISSILCDALFIKQWCWKCFFLKNAMIEELIWICAINAIFSRSNQIKSCKLITAQRQKKNSSWQNIEFWALRYLIFPTKNVLKLQLVCSFATFSYASALYDHYNDVTCSTLKYLDITDTSLFAINQFFWRFPNLIWQFCKKMHCQ